MQVAYLYVNVLKLVKGGDNPVLVPHNVGARLVGRNRHRSCCHDKINLSSVLMKVPILLMFDSKMVDVKESLASCGEFAGEFIVGSIHSRRSWYC